MKSIGKRWILAIALLLVLLTPTRGVIAATEEISLSDGGIVLVGEPWTLPAGDIYKGDVVIISADATIEKDAILEGDLAVIGGNATVHGTVRGDVAVVNGNVRLSATSVIEGDVSFVGGELSRETGAIIKGDIIHTNVSFPVEMNEVLGALPQTLTPLILDAARFAPPEPGSPQWIVARLLDLITGILGALFSSIILAAIAAFFVIVWPEPTRRVAETVQKVPVPAFLVGILVGLTVIILGLLLIITICLSPFGLLLYVGLLAAWLMGWSAAGEIVGTRLWEVLNLSSTSDALPAAAGTFLISLLAAIPCVGTLFGIVVGSVGIGAVVLSYFGTRVPETV